MINSMKTRDERIAEFVQRQLRADTHHLTLQECDVCGWLDFACSTESPQPGVTVERMADDCCPRCANVQMRHPEVFEWVLLVVKKHGAAP